MADQNGLLDNSEKGKIKEWLDPRTPSTIQCPACKNAGWDIADHLVELHVRIPGKQVLGGTVYPLAQLICQTCGFTMLFNAVRMGVIGTEDEERKKLDASDKKEASDVQ